MEQLETQPLQTRTEHSRSLEDAEQLRALHTLTKLGLFIPLSDIETFHGRVKRPGEETDWSVDPSFSNGSNDSGNYNVNNRPTLYTSDAKTAEEFAEQRRLDVAWSHYMGGFVNQVNDYSFAQKLEWLKRENTERHKWWESLDPSYRKYYQAGPDGGPIPITMEELSDESNISLEAEWLEREQSEDKRSELWQRSQLEVQAQVHEITSHDSDAVIIDFNFNPDRLDEKDRQAYHEAIRALVIPVTEGSPVRFEAQDAVVPFVESAKETGKRFFTDDDVETIAVKAGIDHEVALQMASAFNAMQLAAVKPAYLAHQLIKHRDGIIIDTFGTGDDAQRLPVNMEYVERFFRVNHVVGVKQQISSATLGRSIDSVSLFDLEKVDSRERYAARRTDILRKLGKLAGTLEMRTIETQSNHLLRLLEDPHSKPEKLIEAAKDVEGYAEIFEADAGNWEGFTLGEHTETVLRNFEENFADELPVELVGPMKLLILAHDLGKPRAAREHAKHRQKDYNIEQAADFFAKLGLDNPEAEFLMSIIGVGVELAFASRIRGRAQAEGELRDLAKNELLNLHGSEEAISENEIEGYTDMCVMLLTCDGGAYTSMSVTNRSNTGKGRFRNAPSFNRSFRMPHGFGKRKLEIAGQNDEHAPTDFTPISNLRASNLRMSSRGSGTKQPKLTS